MSFSIEALSVWLLHNDRTVLVILAKRATKLFQNISHRDELFDIQQDRVAMKGVVGVVGVRRRKRIRKVELQAE
jgi:hypothetical protein